jgi:Ca-activated chloride channel family protein
LSAIRQEFRIDPLRISNASFRISVCIAGLSVLFFYQKAVVAQPQPAYMLFVLDASGSMKSIWNGKTKFELAAEILSTTIDSVTRSNQKAQFALRVFGHQSPRSANNCRDSRLEVPFSKGNAVQIIQRLTQLRPQGQTPIEYSLKQSLTDFPDTTATNAIILITDGNETCGGDYCRLAAEMAARNIALRPFIVGLGLNDSLKKKLECLGNFFDVQNEDMFSQTMRVIISRVLNPTTCQINLLDAYDNPTKTNVEMTLYDRASGVAKYQFIHTLNSRGLPDTLQLDPKFQYDLTIHSIPEVKRSGIGLAAGTHNIISAAVPMGTLELIQEGASGSGSTPVCVIRKSGEGAILQVQDAGTSQRYLAGNYDLEILTLPEIFLKEVRIDDSKTNTIKIPRAGILLITPGEAGVASVFSEKDDKFTKVYDFGAVRQQRSLSLQPGRYVVIYRPDKGKQAERTKQTPVLITSGKTTSIRL